MLTIVETLGETTVAARQKDALDRNLIALLERDARAPTASLARRLGVARTTIKERIARLEREGVIQGYAAIICPEAETPTLRAMVMIACQRVQVSHLVHRLRQFPEVSECHSVTGPHDLMCQVEVPQAEDLDALIHEIAQIDGVGAIDTTIVLATKFETATVQRPPTRLRAV